MTTTDWRELCERLTELLELCQPPRRWEIAQPDLIATARAALAQPEPEAVGPTLDDINKMCERRDFSYYYDDWGPSDQDSRTLLQSMMNEAIGRWGRPASPPAAPGEVKEVAAWLRAYCDEEFAPLSIDPDVSWLTRAADLLERQAAPVPVPAGEVEHAASVRRMCDIILGNTFGNEELDSLALLVGHHPDVLNAPPAPAEDVGELVAWLCEEAVQAANSDAPHAAGMLTWAAQIVGERVNPIERQGAPVPVAVTDRLPEPSIKVLAHYFNDLGKGRTICAIWVPAKTRSDSYGDDDFTEYDEVSDTFYWPEGWYEAIENWDDLGYVKVDEGEVIYWQPLPQWPSHALPLRSGEVEA